MISFIQQHKKIFVFLADIITISVVAWLSFFLRFEGEIPAGQINNLNIFILFYLILNLPIFYWQKMYHFTWAYVGLNEFYRLIKSIIIATLILTALIVIFRDLKYIAGFPRSIIFISAFLNIFFIGILRLSKRFFVEFFQGKKTRGQSVLIIGADNLAEELARSILKNEKYNLIGFVDEAKAKQNVFIRGKPVLGKIKKLPLLIKSFNIQEIIIALEGKKEKIIREIVQKCRELDIKKIRVLPSFTEIINEKVSLNNVRNVSIEDLLGRSPVQIDTQAIKNFIVNKKILVTGAAGSIGSQLCKEILKFRPAQLIALDQNETGIFYLKNELEKNFPEPTKNFEIADICDEKKIEWLFNKYHPEIVFHAAAYKHVPLMEEHPLEATKNNIFGTLNIAQASIKHSVKNFVFISTDKAVNPTSVMGATKQVGEMICLWLNKKTPLNSKHLTGQVSTLFCAVRFGNVLDSQGNVVGLFEKQIKKGGPVEVTHPEMKRFFMITAEACLLVMQAGTLSKGGEVFILDMGQPIKIVDLAKEMITLAGYQPDVDIPIVFTQLRPGEKLFEEILTKNEIPTRYEKIYIAPLTDFNEEKISQGLKKLKDCLDNNKRDDIIKILKTIVPNYKQNN